MEVFLRSDDNGLGVAKGSVEVVENSDQGNMIPVVLLLRQLGRMTGRVFLASRRPVSMDAICDIFSWRAGGISAQRWAMCCMWKGGGRVEATREVGRCPRERRGPGPEAARMNSVPIDKKVTEPGAVGARRDSASAGADAVSRATEVEVPFAAVYFSVDIMVDPERARGCTRGQM